MPDAPLDGRLFGEDQPCFGCAVNHPIGFHLAFERDGEGVVSRFVPGAQYEGPPGIMHGGLVMTLADEAAAWAVVAKLHKFGFTAQVEGKFKRPVRTGQPTELRAKVVKLNFRVVRVGVEISQHGQVCFDGLLVFALLNQAGAEKLLERPLPEAWKRFAAGGG